MACTAATTVDTADPKTTLEAAISLNLARFFTRAPETSNGTGNLVFCVKEGSPIARDLAVMQAGRAGSMPLTLRSPATYDAFFTGCDIAFIPSSDQLSVALGDLSAAGVVTISDAPGFLAAGGTIMLVQRAQKISFSVNMTSLRKSGKALSSRVLKLATEVRSFP
ncbi:MAG: YfiR family protein [Kordiimonadaceae bacterium]|nr:YfiR family protein [Kordiimonadaceae bacterium]